MSALLNVVRSARCEGSTGAERVCGSILWVVALSGLSAIAGAYMTLGVSDRLVCAVIIGTTVSLGLIFHSLVVEAGRRRTRERINFLTEASELLFLSLDPSATARSLTELAVRSLCDVCLVDLVDPATGALARTAVLASGRRRPGLSFRRRDAEEAPFAHQVMTRASPICLPMESPLLRSGLEEDIKAFLEEERIRHLCAVPLSGSQQTFGVVWFLRRSRPPLASDFALMKDLGRRAAAALENARLFLEAQEAIRFRDEFISVAGHELRAPLTPLKLHLDMLSRTLAGPFLPGWEDGVRQRVELIRRQQRRLVHLVDELLDASRIESGRLELRHEQMDLAELAADVLARMRPELLRAGCKPTLKAPVPVLGRWDSSRLERVITNLLSNAAKYARGTPVELTVEPMGLGVRLSVSDQGRGIEPEHQLRIFERYERVASTALGGLGLGLYIAREIIEAHGGRIFVKSQPGLGSTFVVDLPRQVA